MQTTFLTYATPDFLGNAQALALNARSVGFSEAIIRTPDDIRRSEFWLRNAAILEQKRGAGYWLWKPYIILEALKALPADGVLMYCDAGRSSYYGFTRFPAQLTRAVRQTAQGFLLGPLPSQLGTMKQWVKRDCLVLLDADSADVLDQGLVISTWSVWRNTGASIAFLELWLRCCEDPRCLTDQPNTCGLANYPEFIDHRHDMSVLSALAYRNDAPYLTFTSTWTHRLLECRPGSSLSHNFYKRPENADSLLRRDNPFSLVTEFLRLKWAEM